jgi:predicted transcriptional regulator
VKPRKDRTVLPSNSLIRQKVMAIIAMRVDGKETSEIAKALSISEKSVGQYMWLAGKNGWLKRNAVDPTDRLQYEIAHKVVRNLDEMLDSDSEERRDHATLEVAKGTIFKQVADVNAAPPLTMIGVRVEVVQGANTAIREGTTGGTAHYIDGETLDGK